MTANPLLATWAAIATQRVIGRVGHHVTHQAGPAHPTGHAPKWVTSQGVNLAALHAAYSATVVHDRRGEDRECSIGRIRRVKPRKRVARTNVIPIRRLA
jgi:hypothetical protein